MVQKQSSGLPSTRWQWDHTFERLSSMRRNLVVSLHLGFRFGSSHVDLDSYVRPQFLPENVEDGHHPVGT